MTPARATEMTPVHQSSLTGAGTGAIRTRAVVRPATADQSMCRIREGSEVR